MEVEIVSAEYDPETLRERIAELQQRNSELHRRCQMAEGAVLRKMKAEQAGGAPLAKRLALAGYAAEQERRLVADALLRRACGRLAVVSDGYSETVGRVIEDIADYFNVYESE